MDLGTSEALVHARLEGLTNILSLSPRAEPNTYTSRIIKWNKKRYNSFLFWHSRRCTLRLTCRATLTWKLAVRLCFRDYHEQILFIYKTKFLHRHRKNRILLKNKRKTSKSIILALITFELLFGIIYGTSLEIWWFSLPRHWPGIVMAGHEFEDFEESQPGYVPWRQLQ